MSRALFRVSFRKALRITFSVYLQPDNRPVRCVASGLTAWAALDQAKALQTSGQGKAWTMAG